MMKSTGNHALYHWQPLLSRVVGILLLVLLLLSTAGCQLFRVDRPGRVARAARDLDHPHPDERRRAINWLVDRRVGGREPYLARYREMAVGEADQPPDPNHLVRASAVRALNRARDARSTPVFIEALQDEHERVRLEGAKALVNLPDPQAVDSLMARLRDPQEDQDVRIAAAEALRHYPRPEVARELAAALDERSFGISWQSRRSLVQLTGQDFRYDAAAWRRWVLEADRPFG
jgi:hypothetical protein